MDERMPIMYAAQDFLCFRVARGAPLKVFHLELGYRSEEDFALYRDADLHVLRDCSPQTTIYLKKANNW